MQKVKLSLIVLVCISAQVFAGSLYPPAGPDSPDSAMYSIEAIYQRLLAGTDGAKRTGAFTGPTGPPGSTGHDLNEVMAKAPSNVVDAATTNDVLADKPFWGLTSNEWGTQTGSIPTCVLSPDTNTVDTGYYAATNLSEVDPDLTSTNIIKDVGMFGITGTAKQTLIPKTGQTTSYGTNDDGFLEKGIAWPSPRFTTNAAEPDIVIDNLSGLMWTRNANIYGQTNWYAALTNCNECAVAGYTDWRLPNRKELESLLDLGRFSPALPSGHPFTDVQWDNYWTSTTYAADTGLAWYVHMRYGILFYGSGKASPYYVWPMRGP